MTRRFGQQWNGAALAIVLFVSGAAASAKSVTVTTAPEATAASPMFMDPAAPGTPAAAALAAAGYERYELFMSGAANVYGYGADGRVRVETPDVPYTTRIVVVRPRDPARFSGNVQLVPIHPAAGASGWDTLSGYAVEHGDALVAVMIGADDNTRHAPPGPEPLVMPLRLKAFGAARYAPIRWGDEDGIRWDVFATAARAVRTDPAILRGLRVRRVYASGWSFTGSFLRTFVNAGFHAAGSRPGHPLVDGYLMGISSFSYISGYVPINSHSANLPVGDPRRANVAIDVPVIEMQSENEAITNRDPQTPDRDAGPGAHRLYEIPGLTHGSGRAGGLASRPTPGCPLTPTDVDMADYGQAALASLDRWTATGVAPPRVPRLRATAGRQARDADGNTLGGLRPAQLDVPVARYGAPDQAGLCERRGGLGSPALAMFRNPLSRARLAALYPGGRDDYLRRYDAAVDALVARRLLRGPDGEREKREARGWADRAFTPEAAAK